LLVPALRVSGGKDLVPIARPEQRRAEICRQLRLIEDDLFLASAGSGAPDPADRHRFERLCAERTQLAVELLLIQFR